MDFLESAIVDNQLPLSDISTSLFLLLTSTSTQHSAEGLFTNLSVEPSWRWYFAMTPFETCFLGLIISQFAVLNLFGIFPLNLSMFVNGMPGGRRKRDTFPITRAKRDIARQLLKLMKRLDPDECSFKAICELQKEVSCGSSNIPKSIRLTLNGLKRTSDYRKKGIIPLVPRNVSSDISMEDEIRADEDEVIMLYEDAVNTGNSYSLRSLNNSSACEIKYPRCPVNREEILDYVNIMRSVDDMYRYL